LLLPKAWHRSLLLMSLSSSSSTLIPSTMIKIPGLHQPCLYESSDVVSSVVFVGLFCHCSFLASLFSFGVGIFNSIVNPFWFV
jgi:hypothetical protein